jgi:hypothetical protein
MKMNGTELMRFDKVDHVRRRFPQFRIWARQDDFQTRHRIRSQNNEPTDCAPLIKLCSVHEENRTWNPSVILQELNDWMVDFSEAFQQPRNCIRSNYANGSNRFGRPLVPDYCSVDGEVDWLQPLTQRPSIIGRLFFGKAEEANAHNRNQTTRGQEQNFPPSPHDASVAVQFVVFKVQSLFLVRHVSRKCDVNSMRVVRSESGRGLPHSKSFACPALKNRAPASWSACSPLPLSDSPTHARTFQTSTCKPQLVNLKS